MRWDWILSPATQCALGAAAFAGVLYLFYALKLEMRAARQRDQSRMEAIEAEHQQLGEQLETAAARLEQIEERAAAFSVPARAGLNPSRRSQALRLFRRGQSAEEIARSLSLTSGEMRLLLKIHGMVTQQASPPPLKEVKDHSGSADMNNRTV